MKEKILELLKNAEMPLAIDEMKNRLGLEKTNDGELYNSLSELEDEAKISIGKKGKYQLFERSGKYKGRLSVHKSTNFGFVEVEGLEKDIRIAASKMNGANHGDIVIVDIINRKTNEGKIIKIIERDISDHVGEYYVKNGQGYVKMDNPRYKDIAIDAKNINGAMPGYKVLVGKGKELADGTLESKVVEVLGARDEVGMDILSIVYEFGIPSKFPDEVLLEVEKIPTEVSVEELVGRRDLRDELIITIDPPTAKDFDQAITVRKKDNGNYHLGVHLADVSNYVKEGSAIDREACKRGNSVYLIDRVIPMLPPRLSNGICSLNEGVDRLTLSFDIEIDNKGNVVNHDIFIGVINSRKRMSYIEANKILENNEMVNGYEPFIDMLKMFAEMGNVLLKRFTANGYLDFSTKEMQIIVDEKGKPIDITKRSEGISEKFNEMCMIVVNEISGTYAEDLDLLMPYRIHEVPDEEEIRKFITFLNGLGYRFKGDGNKLAYMMQQIIDTMKEKEEWRVLGNLAIRAMKKAKFSPDNVGHFGLGLKAYIQTTAAIRRAADIKVHRQLKASIGVPGFTVDKSIENLRAFSTHVSITEERAVKCERATDKMKAAEYMEGHKDEEYDGIISGLSRDGIWVQLDNLIEGLIRMNQIGNDYFEYNEKTQMVVGRGGKAYRIGEKVRVIVTGASKKESEIDFAFVGSNVKGKVKVKK